jgi:multiple sugar transport system ATP-binding protein
MPASSRVKAGEQVGLSFMGDKLSLFDNATGLAIKTALHDGAAHG